MQASPKAVAALLILLAFAGCSKGGGSDPNQAPRAVMTITPGMDGRTFEFDAGASTDPDGDALTYAWNYTLGSSNQSKFSHTFPASLGNGVLVVTLVVTDVVGNHGFDFKTDGVTLGNGTNKGPVAVLRDTVRWVKPGETVRIDMSKASDPDGDPLSYQWYWGPRSDFVAGKSGPTDPYKDVSAELDTFNTAIIPPGENRSALFNKPGTYGFSCHPHPWMTGRLTINATRTADPDHVVDMLGYRFLNGTVELGLGTRVVFRNSDGDAHTASVLDYLPGTTPGGNGPVLTVAPPAGEYVARVYISDGKNTSTSSWGFKVSDDAPPTAVTHAWMADPGAYLGQDDSATTPPFDEAYNAWYWVNLTWQDPSGAASNAELAFFKENTQGTRYPQCPSQRVAGVARAEIVACFVNGANNTVGDKYVFKVTSKSAAVVGWQINVNGFHYPTPGFGDFNALRCHPHPNLPPHCY